MLALAASFVNIQPGFAASASFREQLVSASAPSQALVQEDGMSLGMSIRDTLSLVEHKFYNAIVRKATYPLPAVQHDKDPASGYNEGSPLYEEQQRWMQRNGDNSLPNGGDFEWVPVPWRSVWQQFYDYPMSSVFGLILQILLIICFAWLYLQYMPSWRRKHADLAFHHSNEADSFTDWRHTPWDVNCGQDWQLCCWGAFCPMIRWADTIGNERVLKGSFWTAFFLMLILYVIGPLTFGISLIAALCIAIYFRQRMRRIFNLSPGEPLTVFYDTLLWCCCPFCALMQEARQVEKAQAIKAYREGEAATRAYPYA